MIDPASPAVADAGPGILASKKRRLREILGGFESALVAFSGGVDSAYLAWEAASVLGDRAILVTADSPSYPDHHRDMAVSLARRFGLSHEFIRTNEMERPEYRANPANRCYYCKQELFGLLSNLARERGLAVVLDGNNADDRGDYRPGRRAARELGVKSPLDEAGLSKEEIRALSHEAGLPTWDEPASACLSSRIPYGSEVTEEKLRAIEGAEGVLRSMGFRHSRVRHHGDVARIELDRGDMARLIEPEAAGRISAELKRLGFRYVSLDLEGYRTGSLNEGLRLRPV
jgi:uncharacterized protein